MAVGTIVQTLTEHTVYESGGANGKSEVLLVDSELIVSVTCRRQKNVNFWKLG